MKCKACDKMMTDFDVTRKDRVTGEYLDLCGACYSVSQKAMSDYDTTVDSFVDFGGDDVYDLREGYRIAYDEE